LTCSFVLFGTTASMSRTSFTPLTARASCAAFAFSAAVSTLPCKVTTPSSVSTLIDIGLLTPSDFISCIFTFEVRNASSGWSARTGAAASVRLAAASKLFQ
jgi:hypothetical protein